MMNWWRRSVFRSYIRHLKKEFGPDWMLKLNTARINAPPAPKRARFEAIEGRGTQDLVRSAALQREQGGGILKRGLASNGAHSAPNETQRALFSAQKSEHQASVGEATKRPPLHVLSSSAKITKVHGSENVGKKRLNTSNIQVKPDVHSYNDTKLLKEVSAGIDVLSQVINTESWWDWDNGSALLYWWWNTASQRQEARDGTGKK
jgi:hypothetical protein